MKSNRILLLGILTLTAMFLCLARRPHLRGPRQGKQRKAGASLR